MRAAARLQIDCRAFRPIPFPPDWQIQSAAEYLSKSKIRPKSRLHRLVYSRFPSEVYENDRKKPTILRNIKMPPKQPQQAGLPHRGMRARFQGLPLSKPQKDQSR